MNEENNIGLWVYGRPDVNVSVATRHHSIVKNMTEIGAPFGWQGLPIPPVPERRKGNLSSSYSVTYPISGITHFATYQIRDARYIEDLAAADDKFTILFDATNPFLDLSVILSEHFPDIIAALAGYRAVAYCGNHGIQFRKEHNTAVEAIRAKASIDINGRNNIFTLELAHYWDAELCQRALDYGPDEVIRRLEGKVPLVKPLMDGVYTVFNDDPNLTFEEFCAINDRFKPVLGLA